MAGCPQHIDNLLENLLAAAVTFLTLSGPLAVWSWAIGSAASSPPGRKVRRDD
jgi:hypothetical protein